MFRDYDDFDLTAALAAIDMKADHLTDVVDEDDLWYTTQVVDLEMPEFPDLRRIRR